MHEREAIGGGHDTRTVSFTMKRSTTDEVHEAEPDAKRSRVMPAFVGLRYVEPLDVYSLLLDDCWNYVCENFLPVTRDRLAFKLTCKASAARDQGFRVYLLRGLDAHRDILPKRAIRAWIEQELHQIKGLDDDDYDGGKYDGENGLYKVGMDNESIFIDLGLFLAKRMGPHPPMAIIHRPGDAHSVFSTIISLVFHPTSDRWLFRCHRITPVNRSTGALAGPKLVIRILADFTRIVHGFPRNLAPDYGYTMELVICQTYIHTGDSTPSWCSNHEPFKELMALSRTGPLPREPAIGILERIFNGLLHPTTTTRAYFPACGGGLNYRLANLHGRDALYSFLVSVNLQQYHYTMAFDHGYHHLEWLREASLRSCDPRYNKLLGSMDPGEANRLDRALSPWIKTRCLRCHTLLEHPPREQIIGCPECDLHFVSDKR